MSVVDCTETLVTLPPGAGSVAELPAIDETAAQLAALAEAIVSLDGDETAVQLAATVETAVSICL